MFLENLQFNINVSPRTYAHFYFDLRSLAEENGLLFPEEYVPLTKNRARKIEVCVWGGVFVCVCVCMCVHMCVGVGVCMHMCMNECGCTYTYVCM